MVGHSCLSASTAPIQRHQVNVLALKIYADDRASVERSRREVRQGDVVAVQLPHPESAQLVAACRFRRLPDLAQAVDTLAYPDQSARTRLPSECCVVVAAGDSVSSQQKA